MVQNEHHAGSGRQAGNVCERGQHGRKLKLFKGLESLAGSLGDA